MKSCFLAAAFFLCLSGYADDKTLPPVQLRAQWSELEALGYSRWQIKEFNGWAVPFDGGSKVFFFVTTSGEPFDLMAANPAYWTADDKRNRRQVFYLVHKNRFYRINPNSKEQAKLIAMIEAIRPKLAGTGKKDPKLLDAMVTRLKDRKPIFKLR